MAALALLLLPITAQAQLAVTPLGASPPSTLVTSLLGPGITVSNVTYTGSVLSAGTFTGGTAAFGFPDGIVLSTGLAASLTGLSFMEADTALGTPGDPDLDALVGASFTSDATVLEFDFTPTQPGIYFEYVFASEEYNAYVGGGFDDVFGFFINGVNVAHLPGTTITVSVDNVNNCSNPSYYVDNVGDSSAACLVTRTPAGRPTAMNGMTTTLRILVSLPPGVPSHLKLAIADTGDAFLDSNVLLRAGSFISLDPSATPTPTLTATATPTPTATPSPTPTPTPCGFPGLTCTPTPLPEDVFFVSKNLFTPDLDGPVSIYVSYPSYPGPYALRVYNSAGENVKNLDQDHLTAPVQRSYLWDGRNEMGEPCASGIYLLSLTEPFDRKLRKVLLVR